MPESVAKESKEDTRSGKLASPRRRPITGNLVRIKVELLDGSYLDFEADRKIRGHELLGKVCDSLNLVEKDYFGLLYEDRGDPRCWIDLEKRVTKLLKHDPWEVRFAVKFYPPEPAQLQEELTRYQLVLAIRKDLLEGRLPCSTVTHALLASYLLQSELGDYEESEVGAGLCKQLKLVPPASCTPELEEKVLELHKTHRGQTPAEAELNYLENAKKLAMYGVDFHPAKDSEDVDITLGVCSSGILVHREKLRINRFAWPKILKISYKRHNFYVKLRPGEFEQFESTVGFKLANHRAAKKLWKTCVEHHTFFRLMSPSPAQRSGLFPRLGSRFRYSGRTHYESRAAPPTRAPPLFSRTLSHRKLSSRSMDALAGEKDESMPGDAAKRHTMPPQPAPRPTIKDKKPPAGAVKVMPTAPPTDKKEEKKEKVVEQKKPAENGTDTSSDPGVTNNVDTTPRKSKAGGFGLFGGKKSPEKSPKEKSPKVKDRSPKSPKDKKIKDPKSKVAMLDSSNESSNLDSSLEKSPVKTDEKPSYTKPYEYTDTEKSPSRTKPILQGAFSYDKEPISDERQKYHDASQSPSTRKAGLAFNYAPGQDKKLVESAEKRKTPEDPSKLITPGIDYVQSAALKEQAKANVIDPTLALLNAERAMHETPVGAAAPVAVVKPENEVQVVIITGKYNPKSKKLDDANGTVLVTKGTINKGNGKIQTEKELINTKSGQITYTNPATGKEETKNGHVDNKTGHILFNSGVIDPKTGKIDPTLAQQYCFVDKADDKVGAKPGREVDLVVITAKYDGKHKKLDASHGHVDVSKAIVGPDGKVSSNFGVIDPRNGRIDYIDPKTGKQEPKQAYVDQKTGNILITTGVTDPKSGKVDSSLGQQFSIVEKDATKANREVRLVVVTSKYDVKNKKLDPHFAHVDAVKGVLSGTDGKIYTEYGVIDPRTGDIQVTDPKTGKTDVKHAQVDAKTGNILLSSGVVDPRTDQLDTTLGQQYSIVDKPMSTFAVVPGKEVQVVAITSKYDTKNKKLDNPNGFIETSQAIISDKDGTVHTNFGILDPNSGKIYFTEPKTGKRDSKQTTIDPKTGSFLITSGVVDPKTGKTDSSLAQQLTVVDKDAPKGIPERHVNLVIVTSKYDPKNKKLDLSKAHVDTIPGKIGVDDKVLTDYGVVDPASGQIIITDPVTGKQEVKKATVDPKTGNLLLTSGVVDPHTGQIDPSLGQQISIVNKPKDKFAAVPGKEVQLVVITNKYDSKNKRLDNPNGYVETSRGVVASDGKVHTNFGILDPKTGKFECIDPKTGKQDIKQAVADPKTGHFILTSGVVDPKTGKIDSSLAQQLSIVDKDVKPVEREIHLVIITTKYDPRTKKIDPSQAHVDTVSGTIGPDGKIRTAVGVVDPATGEIIITDPKTGKQEVKKAQVDPSNGHMLITSQVVDPNTGRVDPTLAQQYSIVNKTVTPIAKPVSKGEVRLVIVTSKYDPKTKTVDAGSGTIDASKGYVSAEDGKIHTDFGIIDPKSGQILYKDPASGKQELKQAEIDPKTGNIIVTTAVVDPKTGKVDPSFAQQLTIVDKNNVLPKVAPITQRASASPARQIPSPVKTPASTPMQTPLQSPVRTSSPVIASYAQKASPITAVQRASPVKPTTAPPEPPKRKIVKIMVVFTKLDPKTKKPDLYTAEVEHLTGILDPNGQIETKYGVIDSNKGTIVVTDAAGQKQTRDGTVLPETGQIFIHSGAVDPKTGKTDPNLGMLLSVAKQDDPVVEITTITGQVDPRTGKVNIETGTIEHTKGKVDADTGHISTKYGVIDPSNGVIFVTNTSGAQDTKPVHIDENNGQITVTGAIDPKTGKSNPTLSQLIVVGTHIDPVVEVTTFVGKVDAKKGVIEPKHSVIESTTGQLNPETNKIDTKYGQIDLVKGTVTYNDPKTGKFESKEVKVDPVTGQVLLRSGQVNPKSGKPDKDVGRLICLRIIQNKVDPVSGKQIVANDPRNVKVDPKTNQIWVAGPKDPQTGETLFTAGQIDPTTGYIITIYGRLDPKTGTIVRTTDIDKSLIKVDPVNGQVYTATGDVDENNQPLYSVSQVDPGTGEIYTKVGKIDPRTGRLVIVKIFIITQKDDKGRVKEVDPKECTIDETTGRIITTKTVYLYQIVDPITGETIDVDPDDPRLKGARTTVTQTMTLSGKIDPVTGRIKTEYGDIDPDTGDIDPSTAVRDPVTGQLILHYSQIDPSHFGDKSGNYTIEKETEDLPANIDIQTVNTHKFSTFGKDESPARGDDPKSFTEYTTSEHIRHQGYVSSSTPNSSKIPISQRSKKTPTPPVVVKTTTKQLLTKNDDGVTHNVEQEVENLGTGEVTFSTHTNKAESLEPMEGKSPYVTARAVTTRTATTHHDLDTKAKTQQMEEKTVAHTLTSSATRQEQRVLTQQVKTTVTTGDQLTRRGSESSLSSGDSGTPIDFEEGAGEGHYYTTEPGSYRTTTTSTVMGNAPFGTMVHGATARTSTGPQPEVVPEEGEAPPDGEVVSSQTISSKTRTVETITYKTERNGVIETRVEQKITIQSDGDPIDHDRALAEAIQEATAMNPDMTVEKIEIQQQSTQP
ncbi:protein 4.1 homolog isoform X2 [Hyposmocoma kahamanoa]|uniref:protein 4.1 homolog isoform X2 n=1 Tax=Hyposmocoma kahamanoa TaxID=1477025 RepID=UPI000E6DA19D|nr:protein 4.1 homolog isoform X2 [Hyposmocoma kahamanoa]